METLHNFSKNQLQLYFNQIKGEILEINIEEAFSNVTIQVGHHNTRLVNLVSKTNAFNDLMNNFKIGDKVIAKYYLSSKKKNGRYYTSATILDIQKQPTKNH